jgi:NADP-reducing hydrogenase subunit HndB
MKLKPADLQKIKQKVKTSTILREGAGRAKIIVHMGTCGIASGAEGIYNAFLKLIEEKKADEVILTTSGCAGLCSREPMATVELKGEVPIKYVDLTAVKVKKIFTEHVIGGKVVTDYAIVAGSERVT